MICPPNRVSSQIPVIRDPLNTDTHIAVLMIRFEIYLDICFPIVNLLTSLLIIFPIDNVID